MNNLHNKAKGRRKAAGFTLIEVLVVLFIISIVTGMAVLRISHNTSRQIKTFANEVTQMISLAEEQAMLEPKILGMSFENGQVMFTHLSKNDKQEEKWFPMADRLFRHMRIPDSVELSLQVAGEVVNLNHLRDVPQIVFSTNGDVTPFVLYIGKIGDKPKYAIQANPDGGVKTISLS